MFNQLQDFFPRGWPFAQSVSILASGLVAGLVTYGVLHFLAPRLASRTTTDLDDTLVKRISGPVSSAVFIMAALASLEALPKVYEQAMWLKALNKVLILAIIGHLLVAALRANRTVFDHVAEKAAKDAGGRSTTLVREFYPLLRKLMSLLLILLAVIAVFRAFNQDVYSIVTALGVGSLAVGLAAQETLANMFAGFTLLIDRQVKPGDRVCLSDGTVGDIMDIGLRSTKVLNFENNVMIIPNKTLVGDRVINYTYPSPRMRGRVVVGVAYGSDVTRVLAYMVEEAKDHPGVLSDPAAWGYFKDFGSSSLECWVTFHTSSYENVFLLEGEVRTRIYNRFQKEGVNIPFNITTLHNEEPLKVTMVPGKQE